MPSVREYTVTRMQVGFVCECGGCCERVWISQQTEGPPCEAMLPAKLSTGERDRLLRGGAAEAVDEAGKPLSLNVPYAQDAEAKHRELQANC